MILEAEEHAAWKAHPDRYAVCPQCGADGELEGTCDTVDPKQPGEPVVLRELMECLACGCRWHEEWAYRGQAGGVTH